VAEEVEGTVEPAEKLVEVPEDPTESIYPQLNVNSPEEEVSMLSSVCLICSHR
jgi:hypothetical protein